MNAIENVLEQCESHLRARKVARRWSNGIAFYGKNGRITDTLVGAGRLHVPEGNGWRPISVLPRRANGEIHVPDLAVRLGASGEIYQGKNPPYIPRSVGIITRGQYRKLHAIGAPLIARDLIVRPAGPRMHFETLISTDGLSDHLIVEEIPDVDGDYLAYELEFHSGNCGKMLPFAKDARGQQIVCDTIRDGKKQWLGVPLEWLRRAIPPVDIDPADANVAQACLSQGESLVSYANARNNLSIGAVGCLSGFQIGQLEGASPGSKWVVTRHSLMWRFLQVGVMVPCSVGIIEDLHMDLAAKDKTLTVVDFDVQIAQSDWYDQSILLVPCNDTQYDKCVNATLDVVWRNTSAVVVDTYYSSPSMDVAYAQAQLDAYGVIFNCLRSAEDANNSAPVSDESIALYCPAVAAFKPVLALTGDFFGCPPPDGRVVPEFANWET